MEKLKIFLASSSELKEERVQFEIMINRKNKEWISRGVFIDLIIWEDFLNAISKTRLQDEYNKAVRDCDIFVMLFFTKVGKYTEEEFEVAFNQFKDTGKPFIYTYFKEALLSTEELDETVLSLIKFKKKLANLGHFPTTYKNIDDLKYQFNKQLDKFSIEKNLMIYGNRKCENKKPSSTIIQQLHFGNGDNIGRNKI